MISKELFSEVSGIDIIHCSKCKASSDLFYIDTNGGHYINIYELGHKCKEWAKNKGYVVGTDLDKVNIWSIKERIIVNHFEVYFEDYLEFEIKACQWILENK